MAQGRSTKIISTMKWIRTTMLSINNSLSLFGSGVLRASNVQRGFRGGEPLNPNPRLHPSPQAVRVSIEEFFWGLGCVGSRTFTADFGGGEPPGELMCPVMDMVYFSLASR